MSVEEGAARGLGLRVGDAIGFSIFGREVEGEVASIRKVDWAGFGANLAFILSPGTLEAAKPFHNAIVIVPPEKEPELIRAVADRWPEALAFQLRGDARDGGGSLRAGIARGDGAVGRRD